MISRIIQEKIAGYCKITRQETYEPLMRTWDWRLLTWLSLLWRNCGRQRSLWTFQEQGLLGKQIRKGLELRRTPFTVFHCNVILPQARLEARLSMWWLKINSRSHLWHPLPQWCSAPELKAQWWWTKTARRSEVLTGQRQCRESCCTHYIRDWEKTYMTLSNQKVTEVLKPLILTRHHSFKRAVT